MVTSPLFWRIIINFLLLPKGFSYFKSPAGGDKGLMIVLCLHAKAFLGEGIKQEIIGCPYPNVDISPATTGSSGTPSTFYTKSQKRKKQIVNFKMCINNYKKWNCRAERFIFLAAFSTLIRQIDRNRNRQWTIRNDMQQRSKQRMFMCYVSWTLGLQLLRWVLKALFTYIKLLNRLK